MKNRIIVLGLALTLLAACNAFDNSSKPYDGFGPNIVPPPGVGGGPFEGNYKGEMTLTENNCSELADEVDAKTALAFNVVQNADLVSLQFEDEREASGSMKDGKTTIVMKDTSNTKIYHLEFTDKGITGTCEYIEGAPIGDQLGDPCAKYSVALSKE